MLVANIAPASLLALAASTTRMPPTAMLARRDILSGSAAVVSLGALGVSPAPAFADDGIKVTILEAGDTTSALPQRAQKCVVDYTLWVDGFEKKQIDSSKGFGKSAFKFDVGVGQVIPGWDRTVRQMHVGEKRRVVIPSSLGYGEKGVGPIPGGADLYFEIALLELKPMPTLSEKQLEWLDTHPER